MTGLRFRVVDPDLGAVVVDQSVDLDDDPAAAAAEAGARARAYVNRTGRAVVLEVADPDGLIFPVGAWVAVDRIEP